MKKPAILALLFAATAVLVSVAHYYDSAHWGLGWARIMLALPVVYAGVNFRRSGAIAVALLVCITQGPLIIVKYSETGTFSPEHITGVFAICVFSVAFGHILRKERENSQSLEFIHGLIRSTRGTMDEHMLYSTLAEACAETAGTREVSIFLYDGGGLLKPWDDPGAAPLPPAHVFHTVAAQREFLVSANPAQDPRLKWYGPTGVLAALTHLAVLPLEYGGRVRGVICIENTTDENFGAQSIALLTAIKQTVETKLGLGEKLREKIGHELQRLKIRDTFSSYLSRTVAEEILKSPDRVDPGGELRGVTVMFTEVTNFKDLMKSMTPEEILSRLNEYFSAAIDTVFEFDGTLDKFIGDNVMAFWGAPLDDPDGERKAVACAVRLHHRIQELNERHEREGGHPFHVCIGINSGQAVAGNIGSLRRMEYTVIGDSVNLAARIKSLSGKNNTPILVSESTRAGASGRFRFSEPLQAAVKGKSETVTMYRVLLDGEA